MLLLGVADKNEFTSAVVIYMLLWKKDFCYMWPVPVTECLTHVSLLNAQCIYCLICSE